MTLEYAETHIKQAIKQANGNTTRARQILIARAFEDLELLKSLTKHHLTGIAAYHIERVVSGRSVKPKAAPPTAQKPPPEKVTAEDEFGTEILKAVANSSSAVFGLEGYSAPQKKGQASQEHIDAIYRMARRTPPNKK